MTDSVESEVKRGHEITPEEILAMCKIKEQHWPHTLESQLDWWQKHSDVSDRFVILRSQSVIVAFLRLRNRKIALSGLYQSVMCVTEVCVDRERLRTGLGTLLMKKTAESITRMGLDLTYLLCRDDQESFYKKCGWRNIHSVKVVSSDKSKSRCLDVDERCMVLDPGYRLKGAIHLFGDIF